MALLLVCTLLQGVPGSDLELEGAPLELFLKTKGRALAGRDVHWHVPAKALQRPLRRERGVLLFVHQGIGIVVPEGSRALEELRRRGGTACVRGKVVVVPEASARGGGPSCAVVVRDLSHRKGAHKKK